MGAVPIGPSSRLSTIFQLACFADASVRSIVLCSAPIRSKARSAVKVRMCMLPMDKLRTLASL
jgi:hypothetical protein